MITKVLTYQIEKIRGNRITFVLVVITALIVLFVGYLHHTMIQAVTYLFIVWLCAFLIDLFTLGKPARNDFPVRGPKRETLWFLLCAGLGMLALLLRFSGVLNWEHLNGLPRLAMIPLIVLFGFPIGLVSIFLLLKYKLPDLGIRFQGLLVALPVIAVFAVANRIVCPESLTWSRMVEEGGGGGTVSVILMVLFTGFISAGLSEEFLRLIGQTRLGAFFGNFGLGWFLTTAIWAALHVPKWYGDSHELAEPILSAIRIIPLGLLWGYLTHRTKSILPSVLVHGSNFWGMQNF